MINSLYLPELREMLAEHDDAGLHEFCIALHPARTVEFMEGLTPEEAWEVLQHADLPTQAAIFSYIDHEKQIKILEMGDPAQIALLIGELAADNRVDLLNDVAPEVVERILPLVPTAERRDILRLQAYPEGTAGAVMTTQFAKISENLKVRQALDEIAHQAEALETIYYVYIVDDEDHLRGLVSARKLLSKLGKPDTLVSSLMNRDLVTVDVTDSQEVMAEKVARYDLLAIPVVDGEHRLLGIITHDDVIDVVREEATEDAHRISAVAPLEEGYLQTHWATLTWKRGIWLVILFLGGLITASTLQSYEAHLTHPDLAWLIMFIPLVISSGGNSGSQSATLIITAMTTGDITLSDWMRVVRREVVMGICLGGTLGLIGYFAAMSLTHSPLSALVIPVTVLLVVTCGTLLGSVLPMVFRRLGLDPALMSNPFVSGIIDLVGVIVYMNVALAFLRPTG